MSHDDFDDRPQRPQQGSTMGILALVLAIPGLLIFPLAIAGLVLGILALKGTARGAAIAGIVIGGIGTVFFLPMAIIAAIAIPNLLESRITANESAAASMLKSGIFAGQITYQAGGYSDRDGDSRGEYGSLQDLGGGQLQLVPHELAAGLPVHGYRFQVYFLDGVGGAYPADQPGPGTPEAIDAADKYFIVYAWPEAEGDTGRRVFCLTQEGTVLTTAPGSVELPPAAGAAFPGLTPQEIRQPLWQPLAR